MRLSTTITFTLTLLTAGTVQASCGWQLEPNDCICMNSTNGALLADETGVCCRDMGQKAGKTSHICNVDDEDKRQTFKDCCKWLKETSLIGHCR
ncbi:hypothetical protein SBRCBS47491_009805 [Sporothrix bragantina]|uniref:Extracellular membrane protein CFEM domain-containing protein n=1 Tax=Sporothrix bragantina TaxID=671064 RepID=A0ABP0CXX9_9PEZI